MLAVHGNRASKRRTMAIEDVERIDDHPDSPISKVICRGGRFKREPFQLSTEEGLLGSAELPGLPWQRLWVSPREGSGSRVPTFIALSSRLYIVVNASDADYVVCYSTFLVHTIIPCLHYLRLSRRELRLKKKRGLCLPTAFPLTYPVRGMATDQRPSGICIDH